MLGELTSYLEAKGTPEDPDTSAMIQNVAKFLEAFFASGEHGQSFVDNQGHVALIKLYALPCLPSNFASSPAVRSLSIAFQTLSVGNVGVILKTFISAISGQLSALDAILPWYEGGLLKAVEKDASISKILNYIWSYINVLALLVKDGSHMSNQVMMTALGELTGPSGADTCLALGRLQRALLWEIAAESAQISKSSTALSGSTSINNNSAEEVPSIGAPPPFLANFPGRFPSMSSLPSLSQTDASPSQQKPGEMFMQLVASIHSLSKGFTKFLSIQPRRRDDKVLHSVVQLLSKILTEHLSFVPKGSVRYIFS